MERSRKIFIKIGSAANKVITSANEYADRRDRCGVGRSHFQLEVEMRRISVACECIANILGRSTLPDGPSFDVRLQDWLDTDEPQQCLDTLVRMERLLQKEEPSWVSWISRKVTAPTEDKIKESVEHFSSCKGYFHFLFSTEIWNNERKVQQHQDYAIRQKSDVLESGSSAEIQTETNTIVRGGHADHTIQEGLNILDQNILVPDQMNVCIIPDTAVNEGRDTAGQKRQETMSDKQRKKEDANFDEIVKWLDGLNCVEKQDETLSLRQPDTCKWLLDTAQYKMWRNGEKPFLWLRGKPGAGKSVLASSVISSIEPSLREGEILAFFYCDFRSQRSTSSAEALRSLLSQLLRGLHDRAVNSGSLLDDLVKAKERGGFTRNNAKELAVFASRVAMLSHEKPLVIVDALDECNDVTSLVQALMQIKNYIRLFVTSRPLHVIMCGFSGLPFISMDDMEDELSTDIELHVTRELDARHRLRDIDAVFKAEICSVLCGKAGGMFRWIQCSIDTLDRCVTRKEVRSALDSLPEGLDGTYERILLAIDTKRREGQLARRALTWLVAALRPLQLSELIEGLSINLETRTLDLDFGPIHNGVLLDACGSLVIYNEKTGIIILSHFSVKEYLMGELILKKLPQYHIDWERAHIQLARSCMCYLTVYLNSPPINVPVSGRREHVRLQLLRDYVLHDAINHFRHLGSQFKYILPDIKALSRDVQQHSRLWNNLCRTAGRDMDSATPIWPASKHDLTLYILVAYAPDSLLQAVLYRTPLTPGKEGTNPLVYAAYFNKKEHARTLLSRGGRLNRRGWDVNGFFLVLPIEVALQTRHYAVVSLFLEEGSTIPPHIFTDLFFRSGLHSMPASTARMLLQIDDFAEAANSPLQDGGLQPVNIFNFWLESVGTYEPDPIDILRRFIQVGDGCNDTLLSIIGCSGYKIWPTLSAIRLLVENGADIHARAATGDSLLHTALQSLMDENDVLDVAKILISHGCDPLEASSSGKTPLHIAVKRGLVSVARYLLSLDASPSPDLLHVASSSYLYKKTQMITLLIENGADVHARAATGDSLLHTALWSSMDANSALDVTKMLVSHGCDPLEANSSGETPLHIAVKRDFVSVARYLLSLGTSPSPDLLHVASSSHLYKTQMIALLIENGADVHARTTTRNSLLHTALQSPMDENDVLDVAKILISHGCDPLEASSSGKTPLHIAVKRGLVSVARYLLSLDASPSPDLLHVASSSYLYKKTQMIALLIGNGADVHARAETGDSPLHTALRSRVDENNALDLAKTLISHGCDPLEANSSGETPLHIAVKRDFVSVARYMLSLGTSPSPDLLRVASSSYLCRKTQMITLLIENGADVHARVATGDSLLHTALRSLVDENNALDLAKTLISHGCDPLEASSSGETPLHIAVKCGFVSVARYLLSLGTSPSPNLLHVASSSYQYEKTQMITLLIENGADVHARATTGNSLLHTALQSPMDEDDALDVVKTLISHGCDPLEAGSSGETPLRIAVKRGFVSVARYLLSLGTSPSPDLLHVILSTYWDVEKKAQTITLLIENGADVHARAATGDSLLHTTLRSLVDENNALDLAKTLISHGCDPLEANSSGETPLHIAVKRDFVSVARYMLSLGTSPPPDLLISSVSQDHWQKIPMIVCLLENGAGHSALLETALNCLFDEDGALATVKCLVHHGCDPFAANSSGQTLLHNAVERGLVSVARYFMSLGMSPSSDLLAAVFRKRMHKQSQMLQCLLGDKTDVDACTIAGDPLLHIALQSSAKEECIIETLKYLVRRGCNHLEPDSHGKTPLCITAEKGRILLSRFLLSLGTPSSMLSDALWITLRSEQVQRRYEMVNLLIDHGASVLATTQDRDTTLHIAVASICDPRTVSLLLSRGCDPTIRNIHGATPFHVAVGRGRADIVELFLSRDVPLPPDILFTAIQPQCGSTPDLDIIKLLVGSGCDTQTRDAAGQTPLDMAISQGHANVVDYLFSAGISGCVSQLACSTSPSPTCVPQQAVVCTEQPSHKAGNTESRPLKRRRSS